MRRLSKQFPGMRIDVAAMSEIEADERKAIGADSAKDFAADDRGPVGEKLCGPSMGSWWVVTSYLLPLFLLREDPAKNRAVGPNRPQVSRHHLTRSPNSRSAIEGSAPSERIDYRSSSRRLREPTADVADAG